MSAGEQVNNAADLELEVIEGAVLPDDLRRFLSPERAARWDTPRELWTPRSLVARSPQGHVVGAALHAARPLSAYRKIVDVVAQDDQVWTRLVTGILDEDRSVFDATHPVPVVYHFEIATGVAPVSAERLAILTRLGFVEAPTPVPTIPSTFADPSLNVTAWSHWTNGAPRHIAPYFGQTTEVTCGAVAALMALEDHGAGAFDPNDRAHNRTLELAFWRRATNLPACEPIGLGAELERERAGRTNLTTPRIFLSVDGPVLLEGTASGAERQLRVDLQEEALYQATRLGVPIERRWYSIDEMLDELSSGAELLLLIDLTDLIADPTPHWVLATEVVNGAVIVSDPWVQYPNGETWVDTFALPLPPASVDRVTRWGDPEYRGVIVLPEDS